MTGKNNHIKVGEDMYLHESAIKHLCALFPAEVQLKFWGKLVNDCSDDEYNCGLMLYVNLNNVQEKD